MGEGVKIALFCGVGRVISYIQVDLYMMGIPKLQLCFSISLNDKRNSKSRSSFPKNEKSLFKRCHICKMYSKRNS